MAMHFMVRPVMAQAAGAKPQAGAVSDKTKAAGGRIGVRGGDERQAGQHRGRVSNGTKDPGENGIHMFEMVAKIEAVGDGLFVQEMSHFAVGFQQGQEVALTAPDRHGVALDKTVGILARAPACVRASSTRCEWTSPPRRSRLACMLCG